MSYAREFPIDYAAAFLSAFDIEGSVTMNHKPFSQNDINQLLNDHHTLTKDYQQACDKIVKSQDNP